MSMTSEPVPAGKTRQGDQPEWRLSHYVMSLFDRIILEPCWHTAVDHGDMMLNKSPEARMNHEQRRRARGIKPAHLDWAVVQPPLYGQLELKYGTGRTSTAQDTTIRLLRERNMPAGAAWTVMQAYEFVRDSGYRLHGNAANIATEVEARWRAADEAKRGAAPVKKRAAVRRAAGPRFLWPAA